MDKQNQIVGCIGRKGSGKSTMLRALLERSPRFFVFDTMGEHDFVPNRFSGLADVDRFLAWADSQDTFAGSLIPTAELEEDFRELADIIYQQGQMVFAVEETPMLCSPAYVPPEFDRLIRLGRHCEVSVFWTAQRAAEVARRLTAATDLFFLFSQTEPRDLDAIADRCGPEIAEKVAELPLHGYLIWDVVNRQELPLEEALEIVSV